AAVNMQPDEIEAWLETPKSRKVGFIRPGESESVGRASGRRIVEILRKEEAELDGADFAHMRKVVGFVRRHLAQGPHEEWRVPGSRWRHSLMNWGHDPLRD
ncbi:MAG: DNA-binding protein, partial [Proteobacteria bacterium]|nr:DNA-binding protein [Pseudomonadota bacterium]